MKNESEPREDIQVGITSVKPVEYRQKSAHSAVVKRIVAIDSPYYLTFCWRQLESKTNSPKIKRVSKR